MFLHLSVILFTGGCLPQVGGVSATHLWADTPWADTPGRPPAQCMLGYTPPAQCMLGYTHPCPMHAGIRSTSGRYAYYWNAFLLFKCSQYLLKSIMSIKTTPFFYQSRRHHNPSLVILNTHRNYFNTKNNNALGR